MVGKSSAPAAHRDHIVVATPPTGFSAWPHKQKARRGGGPFHFILSGTGSARSRNALGIVLQDLGDETEIVPTLEFFNLDDADLAVEVLRRYELASQQSVSPARWSLH
jgi:hypothetical protein